MTDHERRISQRVPARFKVSFVHEGDYLISHSRDISVDGMFLYTERPPAAGEKTILTFTLGNIQEFEVAARVVWVNQQQDAKDRGMAVKFIKPTRELQTNILKVMNKVAILT